MSSSPPPPPVAPEPAPATGKPARPAGTERPEMRSLATFRRLVLRFGPHRARAAGVFGLLLVRSGLELGWPLLVAAAIDSLVGHEGEGGGLPPGYLGLLAVLAVVLVLKNVFFYVSHVAAARLGQDLENDLRTDLFRHVLALRFRYHDENRSGKTIARSLRDMEKARHFFREVWFGYLEVGLLLAVVLTVVLATHWSYGVVVIAAFGLGITGAVLVGSRIARMDRDVSDIYDDVTTVLQENVAGARVVRAFGRESHEVRKFGGQMDRYSGSWASLERFWTGLMPAVNHLYHLCLPAILLLGAYRMGTGAGSVGEVAAVLLFVRMIHHRIRPLTRMVILGQQAIASASRVFEVLDRTEIFDAGDAARVLPATGGDLRLEDVHFGHGADAPVLRGVSLHVPAGASLGILGPTGSGKSSLVQLLPRFYDPDRGSIHVDGIDIRELDVHALRATVGLVFQEPFLFCGSVAQNIAYGNPGISQEDVVRCAKLAAAHEFIEALPRAVRDRSGRARREPLGRTAAAADDRTSPRHGPAHAHLRRRDGQRGRRDGEDALRRHPSRSPRADDARDLPARDLGPLVRPHRPAGARPGLGPRNARGAATHAPSSTARSCDTSN